MGTTSRYWLIDSQGSHFVRYDAAMPGCKTDSGHCLLVGTGWLCDRAKDVNFLAGSGACGFFK